MSIGILGGTFDPIHQGHVAIANRALEFFDLDSVIFMVARVPPHKQGQAIGSAYHRFAMVALETRQYARLQASDWELRRPGPSYTADTLRLWTKNHPQTQLCFIAGADALSEIHTWKDYAKLLARYCFVFVQRPGIEISLGRLALPADLKERLTRIQDDVPPPAIEPGRSFVLPSYHQPVSSTQIRRALVQRRYLEPDLLSAGVLEHIRKYRLYERIDPEASQGVRGD